MLKSFFTLGIVLVLGVTAFEKCGKPQKNASKKQQTPVLTQATNENENWILSSDFEKVEGTTSLYIAEAHPEKTPSRISQPLFVEVNGCPPGWITHLPKKEEKIKITRIRMRSNDGFITQDLGTDFLNFTQAKCK